MTSEPTLDIVIRGGTIVDGGGGEPFVGDVGILGDRLDAIGMVSGRGWTEIDATGMIVTPGFVDVHTHYDGQAIWSDTLNPSSSHGVTTVILGNCGVGFAPCRPEDHDLLVRVMEGVEDIPGAVMAEGLDWNWTSFPEYLDALEARRRDIDVGAFLPHSPLRVFVMGERGARRETATAEDLRDMRDLAREAAAAGALGFASSRVSVHKTADGDAIPSYQAALEEMIAIGDGLSDFGEGIIQIVPDIARESWDAEIDFLRSVARGTGRRVTFTFGIGNEGKAIWRDALAMLEQARGEGLTIIGQVFPRPVGLIAGFDLSVNPFCLCASYEEIAGLPLQKKLAELTTLERRARILSETPHPGHPLAQLGRKYDWMFPFGASPDYEPSLDRSVSAQAHAAGVSPGEWAYDYLLTESGKARLLVALGNFPGGSLDDIVELLGNRNVVIGLGDGGAHYGMICDASYPTFLLTHLVRDRQGIRVPVEAAIRMLSADPARLVGLQDRGLLRQGYKADVNLIDLDRLELHAPEIRYDLPAGGRRLDQRCSGILATIVSGQVIRRDGDTTGIYPGRVIRGRQPLPADANHASGVAVEA